MNLNTISLDLVGKANKRRIRKRMNMSKREKMIEKMQ
jgi:hypothetical protein